MPLNRWLAIGLIPFLAAQAQEVSPVVSGNTQFAFDLYQKLAEGNQENVFFSPYSLSVALAMTARGASGPTLDEIQQVTHLELPVAEIPAAFAELNQALTPEPVEGCEPLTLELANGYFSQKGFSLAPEYLNDLRNYFQAEASELDFAADPEAARGAINAWASQKTHEKIQEPVPQGGVDESTKLALLNAIYFKGNWQKPFDKAQSGPGYFTALSGKNLRGPMMHDPNRSLAYYRGSDYQAALLPYCGQAAMLVLLPDEGKFAEFESRLSPDLFKEAWGSLEETPVDLAVPRFKFTPESVALKDTLQELGIVQAFGDDADFTVMRPEDDLKLQDVFHQAMVAVDEAGTEAAAVSAVAVGTRSLPAKPEVSLELNRSFVFAIVHPETQSLLFLGRLTDPAQGQ